MMYSKRFTPAEIVRWEAQNITPLPALDLKKLVALQRWQAEQRRIANILETRRVHRLAKKADQA